MGLNIIGALVFLIQTFFSLYIAIVLIRVLLQYFRAPFSNPICQFILNITNFGFKTLRKIIPGFKGIDFAGVVFALLLAMLNMVIIQLLKFQYMQSAIIIIIASIFYILDTLLSIFFWSIIIRIIFGFIAGGQLSHNPFYTLTFILSEPILRPIRNRLPISSGFDLSPLVACLLISVVRILFNIG